MEITACSFNKYVLSFKCQTLRIRDRQSSALLELTVKGGRLRENDGSCTLSDRKSMTVAGKTERPLVHLVPFILQC